MRPSPRLPVALGASCLLLLGLAYALQVHALDRQDLWGDEAVSALVLESDVPQIWSGRVDPFHPPLYFLLLHFWTRLAGRTEFAIRYFSLAGALIGVACVERAAAESHDRATAGLALALAAVAPFIVYYAQEARMYSLALAFNAGALWAATAALRRTGRRGFGRAWAAFAGLALGAVYTYYLSFLLLLGLAAGLGLAWRRRPRLLALAAGTALAMGAVYLPCALSQLERTGNQFPFRPQVWTWAEFWRVVRDTLQAFSVGQTLYPDWGWLAVGLMFGLAALGGLAAWRSRRPEQWLPGLIVIVVLVVGWLFSARLSFFEPRYLIIGMPAYLILVAAGLRWIGRRRPALAGGMLAAAVAAAAFSNYTYYTDYRKGNYGELMRTVAANARPGDLLLLNNPLQRALFEYYRPAGVDHVYLMRDAIIDLARLDVEMTRLTAGRGRVWLVMLGNPAEYDPQFRAEHWLATHGAKNYYAGFGDATLALYVMASAAGATHPASVTFGGQIALAGYRLSAGLVRPGDTLVVELDWQAVAPPDRDYTVFVQLLAPDGTLLAQVDTPPVGGTRPTGRWAAGETVSDRYALLIPSHAPEGQGRLIIGFYPWPDMTRLRVTQAGGLPVADDAVQLTTITLAR